MLLAVAKRDGNKIEKEGERPQIYTSEDQERQNSVEKWKVDVRGKMDRITHNKRIKTKTKFVYPACAPAKEYPAETQNLLKSYLSKWDERGMSRKVWDEYGSEHEMSTKVV